MIDPEAGGGDSEQIMPDVPGNQVPYGPNPMPLNPTYPGDHRPSGLSYCCKWNLIGGYTEVGTKVLAKTSAPSSPRVRSCMTLRLCCRYTSELRLTSFASI